MAGLGALSSPSYREIAAMKVRFTSDKERQPTVDSGIKVIYAPGKRLAFRLRWYLILLLVASPVLWFVGNMLSTWIVLDAPARVVQPLTEVRALESGVVVDLPVVVGASVAAGELLIALENSALSAQYQAVSDTLNINPVVSSGVHAQQQILQQQLNAARLHSQELQRLVRLGAATRAELTQSQELLGRHQVALINFERNLEPSSEQQLYLQRNQGELQALSKRLERLQIRAQGDVLVRSITVTEGEAVAPGTALMQLQSDQPFQVQVFLDAQQRELAYPGQRLKLRFPDGSWRDAVVSAEPSLVARLPVEMRSPFTASELGLLLIVETLEPLPKAWQLDNLPLQARFPNRLQRWLQ